MVYKIKLVANYLHNGIWRRGWNRTTINTRAVSADRGPGRDKVAMVNYT